VEGSRYITNAERARSLTLTNTIFIEHNERIKRHQIRGMGRFRQDFHPGELQVVRVRAQDFLRGRHRVYVCITYVPR
jgi:hypothetical protein